MPIDRETLLLIAIALVPSVFLLVKVYKEDRLEAEPVKLLVQLVLLGTLSTIPAVLLESLGEKVLIQNDIQEPYYSLVRNFLIIAVSEEVSKYILLKLRTWKDKNFNCTFDGVVYAVFVSLGFAMFENILYVFNYGFSTGIIRNITAIPGHACFGVFMGINYGIAKREYSAGKILASKFYKILGLSVAVIMHGMYDYIATTDGSVLIFAVFVIAMVAAGFIQLNKASVKDTFIMPDVEKDASSDR
ncbi:MAG: PrsW family intramembrane metalloprotease [Lachnospiraceae bacterium]|nr:PrsW family intramembrane metalloprotease [Lachnospiraceae bacterium]